MAEEKAAKLDQAIDLLADACEVDRETAESYVYPLTAKDKRALAILHRIAAALPSCIVKVKLKDRMIVHVEPLEGLSVDQQLALYYGPTVKRVGRNI